MRRLVDMIWRKYGIIGMCFAISIGAHVLGLVVFGSYKLFQYIYPKDGMFAASPFRKKAVQLRSIQHKVMLKKPPNAKIIRRLAINKLTQVNLPMLPNDNVKRKFEISKNFMDGGKIFGEYDVAENVFGGLRRLDNAFQGNIYALPTGCKDIPGKWPGESIGTIYARQLNVPPQKFDLGFPGVSDRFEWFGIDYQGSFYVKNRGDYRWALSSDDGSLLYIDKKEIIDNNGIHGPKRKEGMCRLSEGKHDIRVTYFQGPRMTVSLQLLVQPPGSNTFAVFNLFNYPVPANGW